MHPQQVPIPGNTNDAILRNLQPHAPDTVTMVPLYPEGDGGRTSDTGRTCNGERAGQKCPSVQSTEQRGRWLDPAPGQCSSAACVRCPGWHEAPGTCKRGQDQEMAGPAPALRSGGGKRPGGK
nr:collagen alpha-1(XII) chain-like isoform X1 [Vicugna pacos]